MIIIKIFEGIGNQMFQYAYARRQSSHYNIPFKLYLVNNKGFAMPENLTEDEQRKYKIVRRWYENDSIHRDYLLNTFNIVEQYATEIEVYDTIKCNGKNYLEFKWNLFKDSIMPYYKKSLIKEKLDACFDKHLLKTNSNSYLEGYFTSECYFKDLTDVIKKDFTFKEKPSSVNSKKMEQMQQKSSICISIRRGDFVNKAKHDVCDMNYFTNAINCISNKIEQPYFYVFSDDNAWAKDNFTTPFPHEFVTHNYPDYMEDFRLMQTCKHHIIPNSTFSWWAAWLGEQPDSIIVAPKRWLNSDTIDYSKVVPERWMKIDN